MIKSKTLLRYKIIYIVSFILIFLFVIIKTKIITYSSNYTDEITITGKVIKYENYPDKLKIIIKDKEKVIASMYSGSYPKIHLGDTVTVYGKLNDPTNNTIPNNFNYKKYLYNNKIYKTFTINNIKIEKENANIFYKIKDFIYKRCSLSPYMMLFITGDKSSLESDTYNSYKDIGIAHMLAISGMHVAIFIKILNKLLFFIPKKYKEILISIFLIFYSFIVGFTASILRVVVFYLLGRTHPNLSNLKRLYWTFCILILLNPFFIYNTGFIYSFVTVTGIILIKKYLNKGYFKDMLTISIYSILFTLPVTALLNYEINLLSIISNLIFIPIITFVIYPSSLIVFVFPKLITIYNLLINILEGILNVFSKINILKINIPKINPIFIILYYLILVFSIYFNKRKFLILLLIIIFVNKISYKIGNNLYINYFDVGQGDSSALIFPHQKNIVMIDTGGKENYHVSDNILNYYKSIGITKIGTLIITHGDFDHMGDANHIIENFKVENVIFNCGEYNDLEQELIKVLDKKNINYYSCIKELNIDKYKFQFLNTKEYGNENDNSNVIYFNYNNYKLLFMGDAGTLKEKDILEKYNLKNIDFLKVGHHGSNTSSSDYFIGSVNPKCSLISVGKNNRYGHPKDEVLDTLKNSKIYRTDLDGSIEIILNKNGYKIRTCPP